MPGPGLGIGGLASVGRGGVCLGRAAAYLFSTACGALEGGNVSKCHQRIPIMMIIIIVIVIIHSLRELRVLVAAPQTRLPVDQSWIRCRRDAPIAVTACSTFLVISGPLNGPHQPRNLGAKINNDSI